MTLASIGTGRGVPASFCEEAKGAPLVPVGVGVPVEVGAFVAELPVGCADGAGVVVVAGSVAVSRIIPWLGW